jgi:hypothetical protein
VKAVGGGDSGYRVVKHIYVGIFNGGSGHRSTLSGRGGCVQLHLFMAEINVFSCGN